MSEKYDVVVIGAGPGGYPAAIRAAQLGKRVAIIERKYIGGECLNWGCIPTNALISATDFYYKAKEQSKNMGIEFDNVSVNLKQMQKWKETIQKRLVGGINQLLKGNNVTKIMGVAKILSPNRVEISEENNKRVIETDYLIIATGANEIQKKGFEINGTTIFGPKEAVNINEIPKNILIITGDGIGIVFATLFAKIGVKVTIVTENDKIIEGVSQDIVKTLETRLKELKVTILKNTKVLRNDLKGEKVKVNLQIFENKNKKEKEIEVDKIFVYLGKTNENFSKLGLNKLDIEHDENNFIKVNSKQQTSIPTIFAVGDCTGKPFLAHKATKQGIIAAEVIAGEPSEADFRGMPEVLYTDPEIAYVGMTEEEARTAGFQFITVKAPFRASGRSMIDMQTEGFVKVIIDEKKGILLGVEIIGGNASQLISEVTLALEMGATAEDIGFTVHPHPTLPEMIMEAVQSAQGKAIHIANTRRKKD